MAEAAVDWVARSIALGSAGVATLNMFISYRTFRRARPKVKVALLRHIGKAGIEMYPEASEYQFILRFRNKGTTAVSVERIQLVHYPTKWFRSKVFWPLMAMRFEPPISSRPLIPALDGMTFRFNVAKEALSGISVRKHLRFRVLLSNGETVISRKIKPSEWLLPGD
ncbi:hypothetical protein [Streptomyces sp. NPDC055013]